MSTVNAGNQCVMFRPYGIIYCALNRENAKVYIGQTTCLLKDRVANHKKQLARSKLHFHTSLRKYGMDGFEWLPIDSALSKEELDRKEVYWIAAFGSTDRFQGYNSDHGGSKGRPSEATKEKMRLAQLGKKWSQTTREKLVGRKLSEEAKAAVSSRNRGRVQSAEERAKRALSGTGRKQSEETKAKIRAWHLGRPLSEEHRAALKGRVVPEEVRRRISLTLTGRVFSEERKASLRGWHHSEETKARMSATRRAKRKEMQ